MRKLTEVRYPSNILNVKGISTSVKLIRSDRIWNHSEKFYEEIYRVYPEYDKWNQWLKENGTALVRRMTG